MLVLLPIPWAIRLLLTPSKSQENSLLVPDFQGFQSPESHGATISNSLWKAILVWLIWTLLVVSLCRPQLLGETFSVPSSGRDLMLAVDVSGSMGQRDLTLDGRQANRLDAVKHVVGDFVTRRTGDRLGLILFGTYAYLYAPLTLDRNTVKELLEYAPLTVAGGKTAIGDAIAQAIRHLRNRPKSNRVLILLTDGSNNVGVITPLKAAELANQENIVIYTVGIGSEAQLKNQGLFNFSLDSLLLSPSTDLDEKTLKKIAKITNGKYFRARNTEELNAIYEQLDKLEPVEHDSQTYRVAKEMYFLPLAVGVFFSMLLAILILLPKLHSQNSRIPNV